MNSIGSSLTTSLLSRGSDTLSNTQKQALDSLLSDVDAENLSDDEAKALVSGIQEAGISEGRGLAQALGAAGIDARGLAEQAGLGPKGAGGAAGPEGAAGGGRPPGGGGGPGGAGGPQGGSPTEGADEASVQIMQSIVDQLSEYTEEEDYQNILQAALEEAGLDPSQPIVDLRL